LGRGTIRSRLFHEQINLIDRFSQLLGFMLMMVELVDEFAARLTQHIERRRRQL